MLFDFSKGPLLQVILPLFTISAMSLLLKNKIKGNGVKKEKKKDVT